MKGIDDALRNLVKEKDVASNTTLKKEITILGGSVKDLIIKNKQVELKNVLDEMGNKLITTSKGLKRPFEKYENAITDIVQEKVILEKKSLQKAKKQLNAVKNTYIPTSGATQQPLQKPMTSFSDPKSSSSEKKSIKKSVFGTFFAEMQSFAGEIENAVSSTKEYIFNGGMVDDIKNSALGKTFIHIDTMFFSSNIRSVALKSVTEKKSNHTTEEKSNKTDRKTSKEVLSSLGLTKEIHYDPKKTYTQESFVAAVKPLAEELSNKFSIPAEILVAQASQESNNGNSALARDAYNFYTKRKGVILWKGKKIQKKVDGEKFKKSYRKYDSPEQSMHDHALFLSKKYSSLTKLPITDYRGRAEGLEKVKYSSEKSYGTNLLKTIGAIKKKPLPKKPISKDKSKKKVA